MEEGRKHVMHHWQPPLAAGKDGLFERATYGGNFMRPSTA